MSDVATTEAYKARIDGLIDEALARAADSKDPILLSITEECPEADPLRFFAHAITSATERYYWDHPNGDYTIASAGVLAARIVSRLRRFQRVNEVLTETLATAIIDPPLDQGHPGPIHFAGFSFDPQRRADIRVWLGFGSGYIVVPQATVVRKGDMSYLTINLLLTSKRPKSQARQQILDLRDRAFRSFDRETRKLETVIKTDLDEAIAADAEHFRGSVLAATEGAREGTLETVTVTRRCQIESAYGFDTVGTIQRLRASYPDDITFAISRRDGAFLGSTPARLASMSNGQVQAEVLSGTTLDEGDEAGAAGGELLGNQREINEHQIDVRTLCHSLGEVCDDVQASETPELVSTGNVRHLRSQITATAQEGKTLVQIVEQINPTAAMCGHPVDAAYEFLHENEEFNRGWFGAPYGWIDAHGNGEFIITDRSAIIRGRSAIVYAGCGVTAEADVEQEMQESELLLQPMLRALGAFNKPEETTDEQPAAESGDDTPDDGDETASDTNDSN